MFFMKGGCPETATPVGYAALIDAYGLQVPIPRTLSAIGKRHRITEEAGWRFYTPRHEPDATLEGHLTFALKYEGLDLAILKRLFLTAQASDIADLVRAKPTGLYTRRIWFLYEWLLGRELRLPTAEKVSYVDAVDTGLQYAGVGENSGRHRVRNNLPGTPEFCPLVFKTPALNEFIAQDLKERARAVVSKVPKDLLARAAAFLLLKDSKSSYIIEGEQPPQDRIQRWGRAIGEAGRRSARRERVAAFAAHRYWGRAIRQSLACALKAGSSANMTATRSGRSPITSARGLRTFRH